MLKPNERSCPYCHLVTTAANTKCIHCHKSVLAKQKVATIGQTYPAATVPDRKIANPTWEQIQAGMQIGYKM